MTSLVVSKSVVLVQGVYFPDEPVTGHIKFHLLEEANITSITVNIVGERTITKGSSSKGVACSTEEKETNLGGQPVRSLKLMDVTECIFSASPGRNMDAGSHSVPFSVKLPPNIPSSIESPQWSVHYKLIAAVMGASDILEKFEQSFSVNRICDLNNNPKVKTPVRASYSGTKFLCINLNMVNASMDIDRSGYVPGEQICINAFVENNSRRHIYYTKISLVQKICHVDIFSDSKKLKCKRMVTDSTRGSIPVNGTQVWQNEQIRVPPIPPSSINDCFGWCVNYWIQMDVVNTVPKNVVTLRIPVIIGNIPLTSLYPQLKTLSPDSSKVAFFQANEDLFSEEQCIFSNKTSTDDETINQSTPKYFSLKLTNSGDVKEGDSLPNRDPDSPDV